MNKQLKHEEVTFSKTAFPIILFLDNITGEANIGSIFRLADAFGVSKIIFSGTPPNLNSNRLKRTSRNTHTTVDFEFVEEALPALEEYKQAGWNLLGLEITSNSNPLHAVTTPETKTVLIAGNERHGISSEVLAVCDEIVHIEMFGENSSMNVAQSVGIALYEITRALQKFHKK